MKKGNLITLAEEGNFEVIIHGCNCFHTMGAGIAREIKYRYPAAYDTDVRYTMKGDITKLGHYTWVEVTGPKPGRKFIIVNAYTQFRYGAGGPHVDYNAVRRVFKSIGEQFTRSVMGYPAIGAGLAGGNWDRIQTIINEELQGMIHHLVVL